MSFVQNFPFFCIILSMFSAILSFILKGKAAKWVHLVMDTLVLIMSICCFFYTLRTNESYTYMMGHFPAPWGNEIRIGILETLTSVFFSLVMLLSVLGGIRHIEREISTSRQNLFYIVLDLMMSSFLALIYTNDLFTAYVFIEILTIAGCGLIMARNEGRNYVSATKYMIMSLVGSGLFLIGLSMLYAITGHLLMVPAKTVLSSIISAHTFDIPFLVLLILMTVGLSIKSGLYPFHAWIPAAYSYATPSASAIMSSLVSKAYIFLLIKLFYRVLDFHAVTVQHMLDILFVFGLIGMIMGSVKAIQEDNVRRMTAFSSVAQIGYIYMGLGFGTTAGSIAAIFHIFSHSAMKSLIFISLSGLTETSGGRNDFKALVGSGYRHKIAGIGFTVGALAMIGMPLTTGFISKYLFASAATTAITWKMISSWIVLAVSTTLNAVYFMRTVLVLYTVDKSRKAISAPAAVSSFPESRLSAEYKQSTVENFSTICLTVLNIFLGTFSSPVIAAIAAGLKIFG